MICVALNYYPVRFQSGESPRFAYYAYGRDYHDVMRDKLRQLAVFVSSYSGDTGRVCCDTAPVRERYWAVRAGLGFIGKNAQLIIPGKGSFFFLGELITSLDLPPDSPVVARCGDCSRCIDSCPTGALCAPGSVDARLCISCQTIENKGDIAPFVADRMGDRVYGCDTCQQCCPWNKSARPSVHHEFAPSEEFLALVVLPDEALDDPHRLDILLDGVVHPVVLFQHAFEQRMYAHGNKRHTRAEKRNRNEENPRHARFRHESHHCRKNQHCRRADYGTDNHHKRLLSVVYVGRAARNKACRAEFVNIAETEVLNFAEQRFTHVFAEACACVCTEFARKAAQRKTAHSRQHHQHAVGNYYVAHCVRRYGNA